MKLIFSGADHEVTGSCHCLTVNGKNILVDCGMEQGKNVFVNQPIPFTEKDIDYVFLTHAHIDHSGLLPLLWVKGFRGKIFATGATVDLCSIMLRDSGHIQETDAEWQNRKGRRAGKMEVKPLYTMEDAEEVQKYFVPCDYNEIIEIDGGVRIRFCDIGHMLGSACIEVWLKEKGVERKLVFSGDIGNQKQPIVRDPSIVEEADYIIIESTYGNRYHKACSFDYASELAEVIQSTFDRGGNVVIPSFAVGRTQEILYFLREAKEKQLIKGHDDFEVYVDSPLAIDATEIFTKNTLKYYDKETMALVQQGINPLSFPGLRLSLTSDQSRAINFDLKPKVIISSSGMCEGGRIRHHLKHNLWRGDSCILFVGYQAVGTLGRLIVDGIEEVNLFGETVKVNAEIKVLEGVSGHADKAGLQSWLSGFQNIPNHVFVVHGEDLSCTEFASFVREQFGFAASAPYSGSVFDLKEDRYIEEALPELVKREKKGGEGTGEPFTHLQRLGRRLLELISAYKGRANRDIRAFSRDLGELCDQYEKDLRQ
ncbi:MAG TPA: MBL fold metallo-hydrolase [Clostridiales bacterium]|nr:MBL fold metallo-hydrolase [Clostridiales bacterium]